MPRNSRIIVIVDHPGKERIAFEVRGTVVDSVEMALDGTTKTGHSIRVTGEVESKTTFKGDFRSPDPESPSPEVAAPYIDTDGHIAGYDTRTHWANGAPRMLTPEAYALAVSRGLLG